MRLFPLIVLMGCYSPPQLTAEIRVDEGPCGEPSKQVVLNTEPGADVWLFRGDEMISDHEADDDGRVTVRWPDTSVDGVQARVGRADTYSAVDLREPEPALYPVWREGRVVMNACPGLADCGVSASGATLQAHSPYGIDPLLGVDGATPESGTVQLTSEHLAEWRFPVIRDGEACAHLEGPAVRLELPTRDEVFQGRLWWSRTQALLAVAEVAARTAGNAVPTGSAVLVVEDRTRPGTPQTQSVRVFGALEKASDVAAVIRLRATEDLMLAACPAGASMTRWTVAGTRIDVVSGEQHDATVVGDNSACLGPGAIPTDPQALLDDIIARLSDA